jgi:transposase
VLFPHLAGLCIDDVRAGVMVVRFEASTWPGPVACPGCGTESARVHSRYVRRLSDTPIGAREVLLQVRVRRLFCDNGECARRTFAEPLHGLAPRHARRTSVLQRVLCSVALALGGRPGARLTRRLATAVSRMTLLRLVRALPDPQAPTPRVLGVDDFALRRGHNYGTVLIDIETRRPVDVLPDRSAASLAAWPRDHPGVEVICRDRAGAYAEGARAGAPDAMQVADRWHLWHNLADAVERTVARHRASLAAAVDTEHDPRDNGRTGAEPGLDPAPGTTSDSDLERPDWASAAPAGSVGGERTDRIATWTRERYAAVHALLDDGQSIRSIADRLEIARGTVRRFARASTVEELLVNNGTGRRRSMLEEFKPYLHQRWNAGCTNAARLLDEITDRGYAGGAQILRKYLRTLRTAGPDQAFATMMCQLRDAQLESWMGAVTSDDLPALHSFVTGLRRDHDAVIAGLTLPWNSGPVEGHVNRIKMLKRQMFGRAKHDLLRKRVLLAD